MGEFLRTSAKPFDQEVPVERHLIVFPLPTCIRQWTDARNAGCLRVLRGDLTDGRRLTLDSGKRWGILLIVDSDIIERKGHLWCRRQSWNGLAVGTHDFSFAVDRCD